jgi:integrase
MPLSNELLKRLAEERLKLTRARMAPNTDIGYRYAWSMFERWCSKMELAALPTDSETVSLYITDMISVAHKKVSTVVHRVWAIGRKHREAGLESPVSREVRELLNGARRLLIEQPRQMKPIQVDQLQAMCRALLAAGDPLSIRNRAILVSGFASGLRGASLVALTLEDIEFLKQGVLVRVRKEKQDQEGKGRYLGMPRGKHACTCPVRSLRDWIEIRGDEPGALFSRLGRRDHLQTDTIYVTVKNTLRLIGVEPVLYGAHSLRAGFITAAGEAGVADLVIAKQTGHRNMEVLRRYFRSRDAFRANAAGTLGL